VQEQVLTNELVAQSLNCGKQSHGHIHNTYKSVDLTINGVLWAQKSSSQSLLQ
jgi:hypothetical protein